MTAISQKTFFDTLPDALRPSLPVALQGFQVRRPWGLLQIHFGEPALHYEVSYVGQRLGRLITGWELGFHCEARDHHLNRLLLDGFSHHLFEIKATLGEHVEAEMWDRGWTKIYEVYPDAPLTQAYRADVATRLAEFITCIHPIFVGLRRSAAEIYR
ncbi:MAG TPA: hypothetical protein PK205_00125 [Promineifilum sp.]|nr:hypothetical protein [Promineifilum sp.]HRO90291.1 hypothetical protein [Promineifilum sp.]HRQ11700.1 hypothetical protein [Promineifilum sp.]